jgi:hypothetical protein
MLLPLLLLLSLLPSATSTATEVLRNGSLAVTFDAGHIGPSTVTWYVCMLKTKPY